MRILVDGKNLSLKTGTGVATYARNVCQVARNAGHQVDVLYGEAFANNKIELFRELDFFDADFKKTYLSRRIGEFAAAFSHLTDAKPFPIPVDGKVITNQFASQLPSADRIWNATSAFYDADIAYARPFRLRRTFNTVANVPDCDIAHWTFPMPIRLKNARNIYTIHDLVPLRLPYATLDQKKVYYRMVKTICEQADMVVTVSETSKRDIHTFFDIADEKVINTYQSVELPPAYLNLDEQIVREELRGLHDVEYKEYILFYGAVEPKKNIGRLLEAYMSSGIDIPLLVVGKDGWLPGKDLDLLKQPSNAYQVESAGMTTTKRRIRRIDYVSFAQLVNLIRGARMVALPSLYEGFGLPIIEGMLCGTPVLTSDLGATREVAGDAAVLVDPYNTRSIRDGLIALNRDPELRARLAASGHERAKVFSAERHALKLNELYERAQTGL